jgi:hypothetical protein
MLEGGGAVVNHTWRWDDVTSMLLLRSARSLLRRAGVVEWV